MCDESKRSAVLTSSLITHHSSLFFRDYLFIYGGAQFVRIDFAEMSEDDFAVFVVKERRWQLTVPRRIDCFDGRLRIIDVEQDDRHRRLHLFQKLWHGALDVRNVINRDRDEIQTL